MSILGSYYVNFRDWKQYSQTLSRFILQLYPIVFFMTFILWLMQSAHYLPHDAGVDGLDADVLAVQVETVHEALRGPDELVALARPGDQAELPLQIHGEVAA